MSTARPGIDVINLATWLGSNVPATAIYRCPGCDRIHALGINHVEPQRPSWAWNGDTVKPVFSPSVAYRTGRREGNVIVDVVCHSFIGCNGAQPGEAIFLGDCTHEYAGKVLPMIPWRDDEDE